MTEPQEKFVTTSDGLNLHYLDWGKPGATPILLLHGLGSNAHYWDYFALSFCDRYHVIALDQRGHGESNWAERYGPRDYVHDLEDFVTSIGLTDFVLVGHSLGGINGILYATHRPDHVLKLAVVDIGPEIDPVGAERMLAEMASEPDAFDSIEEVMARIRQLQPRYSMDFIEHQARHATRATDDGVLVYKCDPALRQNRMGSPEWLWEYLPEVLCATLVLRGVESDVFSMDTAKQMTDALGSAVLTHIDQAGHSVPGDNPEAFALALQEFL
jgi:pimeloyl-ACP methyl ester carboxylesterase